MDEPTLPLYRIHQKHGRLAIGLIVVKLQCGLYSANLLSMLLSPPLVRPRSSGAAIDSNPAQRSIAVLLIPKASYSLVRLYLLLLLLSSSRSGRKVASVVRSCHLGRVTQVLFVEGSREADQRHGSCLKVNYSKIISIGLCTRRQMGPRPLPRVREAVFSAEAITSSGDGGALSLERPSLRLLHIPILISPIQNDFQPHLVVGRGIVRWRRSWNLCQLWAEHLRLSGGPCKRGFFISSVMGACHALGNPNQPLPA